MTSSKQSTFHIRHEREHLQGNPVDGYEHKTGSFSGENNNRPACRRFHLGKHTWKKCSDIERAVRFHKGWDGKKGRRFPCR